LILPVVADEGTMFFFHIFVVILFKTYILTTKEFVIRNFSFMFKKLDEINIPKPFTI